nr:hypothetical protein [Candidatus Paceibacterota bacterium]
MGGGARVESYDDAVRATRTVARESVRAFSFSEQQTRSGRGTVHDNLNVLGKVRECRDSKLMPNITPIAIAMDVT